MSLQKSIPKAILSVILFLLLILPVFSQTSKETRQWQACQKKAEKATDTAQKIEIYKQFLEKNESSYFAAEARRIIEEPNDFEEAKSKNTIEAYKIYLTKHPDGDSDRIWNAEESIRDILFKGKSINDMISDFIQIGVVGEFSGEPASANIIEKGTLRGEKYKITILKCENGDALDVVPIHDLLLKNVHFVLKDFTWTCKTSMTFSGRASVSFGANNIPKSISNHGAINIVNKCQNNTKYLETFFFRDDPFFIGGLAIESSVFDKIREFYKSIIK